MRAGSFAALLEAYLESPEWRELSPKTQKLWQPLLARIEGAWADLAVRGLEPRHVLALRDTYADTPGMANNLIRALSSVLAWSVPRGWRDTKPCQGLRKLKGGYGYAPWNWEDINLFQDIARADLWQAAALALYTGQRLDDVVRMKWDDMKDGLIAVVQQKTGKQMWIPMHQICTPIFAKCRVVISVSLPTHAEKPGRPMGLRHPGAMSLTVLNWPYFAKEGVSFTGSGNRPSFSFWRLVAPMLRSPPSQVSHAEWSSIIRGRLTRRKIGGGGDPKMGSCW